MIIFDDNNSPIKSEYEKVVVFDRDATLIEDIDSLSDAKFIKWATGVPDLLRYVFNNCSIICVASNQRSVSMGKVTLDDLKAVTVEMFDHARKFGSQINTFVYCPHGLLRESDRSSFMCACRKPQPGMLDYIVDRYGHESCKYLFVGDADSDKFAAENSRSTFDFISVTQNDTWINKVKEWVEA